MHVYVYMSSYQHDRSDRYYFCNFKDQLVVYNLKKFCFRSVFKHIGRCLYTHKLKIKSQCSARWYARGVKSELDEGNTGGAV